MSITHQSPLLKKFMTASKGLFITFEGIVGSGKSTQIKLLKDYLESCQKNVLLLREPGGVAVSEKIRTLILDQNKLLHPLTEAFLFLAARTEILTQKVLPHLSQGGVVLLDRYLDSTLVYQSTSSELSKESLLHLHSEAPLNFLPQITFYLSISLETSKLRMSQRGNVPDYFEARENSFHQKLIQGYESLLNIFPERIKKIPAEQKKEEIFNNILSHLKDLTYES